MHIWLSLLEIIRTSLYYCERFLILFIHQPLFRSIFSTVYGNLPPSKTGSKTDVCNIQSCLSRAAVGDYPGAGKGKTALLSETVL